jgi:hypothetical protein
MWLRRSTLGHDYAHTWSVDHPSLHGRSRPRVLVEAADGGEAFARVRLLERHGYDTAWCPGPPEIIGSRCPLVAGKDCPLTDWADVVVTSLGVRHPAGRDVLEAIGRVHPGLPVVVEASLNEAADWPQYLVGHEVVREPATTPRLLEAIEEALDRPRRPHAR